MRSRRRSIGGGGRRNDVTTHSLRDRKFVEASGEEAEEEERKERVRDRKSEATELMEKIRKRSEERENRRKGLKSSNEETASVRFCFFFSLSQLERKLMIAESALPPTV